MISQLMHSNVSSHLCRNLDSLAFEKENTINGCEREVAPNLQRKTCLRMLNPSWMFKLNMEVRVGISLTKWRSVTRQLRSTMVLVI